MTTATFPPFPPGPSLDRGPPQLFQSYQLALCRSPWPFLGRYVCTFQKNNWTIWQLMGGTSAICWNKGGQLLVTGSLGERSKIVIVIQKNLLPIVCLQYSSKLIPTNQHLDSEENKPKLNKKTILPNKRPELAKERQKRKVKQRVVIVASTSNQSAVPRLWATITSTELCDQEKEVQSK